LSECKPILFKSVVSAPHLHPNGSAVRLCVAKEWHRFPSSFFVPSHVRLDFVRSRFRGILPAHFPALAHPNQTGLASAAQLTRTLPRAMNDRNRDEPDRYVPLDSCDFLVDLATGTTDDPLEPDFGSDQTRFRVLYQHPFLLAQRSPRLLRAFHVPWLSQRHCRFGAYQLLQAVRA